MRQAFCAILTVFLVSFSPAALADPKPSSEAKAATPASQPAAAPTPSEPQTTAEAVASAKLGLEYVKARNWLGASSIAIWLAIFALKLTKVFERIGKRWLYIILPVLGIAAMLLSALAGGVSWEAAWMVLGSAPVAALASDFVKRGVLAQEPTTPINAPTKPGV
jgi:hypothetical protein